MEKTPMNILLGVTASIAAYKACDLARMLIKKGYSVECVMSRDAGKFITQLTLETLTGHKAVSDMFALPEERYPGHISLADRTDMILIAPATADIIGKISSGICDDILTATVCASKSPVLIAPAMNERMYENPIIREKIDYLKDKGYYFVDPVRGSLTCGREGVGHLAPLEQIINETERILEK